MFDGKAFGQEIVNATKAFVERSLAPVLDRLSVIERTITGQPKPIGIEDVKALLAGMPNITIESLIPEIKAAVVEELRDNKVPVVMLEEVKGFVSEAIAALPSPVTVHDVAPLIMSEVQRAVSALPKPKDGESVTIDDLAPLISGEVGKAVSALPPAEPGKSVTIDDVRPLVAEAVADAVRALPKPEKGEPGKSITVEDVAPLIVAEVDKAISALPPAEPGKDGVGVAGAAIGRDGNLLVTLSNGSICDLGRVVGKDGLSASDFNVEWTQESDREISVTCSGPGSVSKSVFRFPIPLHRGVFSEGQTYERGDMVTFGGSQWHCNVETVEKPGEASKAWTLAVKRGRDGKDRPTPPKPPVTGLPLK